LVELKHENFVASAAMDYAGSLCQVEYVGDTCHGLTSLGISEILEILEML
jgi:hypothetical protein